MPWAARGVSYGWEALCVARSEGASLCSINALCRSPGTFTDHPLYFVRKAKDLGMETREVPGFHSRWARERHRSGACSGSHERAHRAVCDSFHVHPGSQPGACSSTGRYCVVRQAHGFPWKRHKLSNKVQHGRCVACHMNAPALLEIRRKATIVIGCRTAAVE